MNPTAKLIGIIPTRNADRARAFYETTLGLRFVSDDTFRSRLRLQRHHDPRHSRP